MKMKYLFPASYKPIGWIILIPSIVLGFYTLITDYEPAIFDINMLTLFSKELMKDSVVIGISEQNIFSEILGVLIIIGGLLVAFSRQKEEDEFIGKIRLESLVWATYCNYAILVFSMLFIYGLSFLWVMILNMFTILIFFIIRFNWQLSKLKYTISHEE